ncbi:MAG: bifunctional UDP-N-acetylglucosamine diphosphorylase/glucosamine-1-phosphate N-acetyltransferase GlmU [Pseudomonadota bacterium]
MTESRMTLVACVLAAGRGTRMRSDVPKVLQPLAHKPLLGHVLEIVEALGADDTVIVYGHGGDAVQSAFASTDLKWALQADQLGTGHALQQAMPQIADNTRVLVLCGDVPLLTQASLQRLLASTPDDAVGVLSVAMDDPTGYGRIIRDDHDSVIRIVEQKDGDANELAVREINSGVFVLPSTPLRRWLDALSPQNTQGEYYLTDVVGLAVAEGIAVHGVLADSFEETMGINDRVQLAAAERVYQTRVVEQLMRDGARVADPGRVDIRGDVRVGKDVFIDINAVFEGEVMLEDGVHIGPNCVIRNATLGAGTQVHANSLIDDATLGRACQIGPFARLRPGSQLADKAKVGNFVEIKKAQIGKGSKVNHLTYIGDATIGEDVNVGAGTITCNYDGANKHQTVIGDGAFIGSGVELVAPVEVGAGATIAAGSTITRGAADGSLTVARARQKTIEGWQRPVKNKK